MTVKRYVADTARECLRRVKEELGPDAIVVSNRQIEGGVEITAMSAASLEALSAQSAPRVAAGGSAAAYAAPAAGAASSYASVAAAPQRPVARSVPADGDDYTTEERKVMGETRKILGLSEDVGISATCARVPVVTGHSESVNVQTRDDLSPEACRELAQRAPDAAERRSWWEQAGDLYAAQSNWKEALDAFRQAGRRLKQAAALAGTGDPEAAANLMTDIQELYPLSAARYYRQAGERVAAERAAAGAHQAAYATQNAAAQTARTAASSQWPYWAIALIALGALAWYFLAGTDGHKVAELAPPPAAQPTRPVIDTTGLATPNLTVSGVDLGALVNSSIGGLRTALTGITDTASAQAAIPGSGAESRPMNRCGERTQSQRVACVWRAAASRARVVASSNSSVRNRPPNTKISQPPSSEVGMGATWYGTDAVNTAGTGAGPLGRMSRSARPGGGGRPRGTGSTATTIGRNPTGCNYQHPRQTQPGSPTPPWRTPA